MASVLDELIEELQAKQKRIDKEIFTCRSLPKEYKMGKKLTQLGVLIDVSKILQFYIVLYI